MRRRLCMIEPIKMKPQSNLNFKGVTAQKDPLNARSAYQTVLNENEGVLYKEAVKLQKHDPSILGKKLDLRG